MVNFGRKALVLTAALAVAVTATASARADGFNLPPVQQGCGPDGRLTPELAILKLKGAANLAPCKPGSIVFVATQVKKKTVIGFAAVGAGWKVGRVYVAGTPSDDVASLSKLLPKKLVEIDLAHLLAAALLLTKGLSYDAVTFAVAPAPHITARVYEGPGSCGAAQDVTLTLAKGVLALTATPAAAGPSCR